MPPFWVDLIQFWGDITKQGAPQNNTIQKLIFCASVLNTQFAALFLFQHSFLSQFDHYSKPAETKNEKNIQLTQTGV